MMIQTTPVIDEKEVVRSVASGGSVFLLLVSTVMLFVNPMHSAAVISGGLLGFLNFFLFRKHLKSCLALSPGPALMLAILKFTFRIGLLACLVYLIIVFTRLHPVPLLAGLSAPVAGIVYYLGLQLFRRGESTKK